MSRRRRIWLTKIDANPDFFWFLAGGFLLLIFSQASALAWGVWASTLYILGAIDRHERNVERMNRELLFAIEDRLIRSTTVSFDVMKGNKSAPQGSWEVREKVLGTSNELD